MNPVNPKHFDALPMDYCTYHGFIHTYLGNSMHGFIQAGRSLLKCIALFKIQ